jgi:tetratricopeptide (TPR) repeat protein
MAVTLPAVLLILDWYPFEKIRSFRTFRSAFMEKLPFLGLSLAASVLALLSQGSAKTIISTKFAPLHVRLAVAVESVFSYLGKMFFPVNLLPFYPYPESASLLSPKYILFVVLAVGLSMACLAAMKKQKVWLAAWCYYLITLLPVIGIIQVGFQSRADRYFYLPSLGPFLIVSLAAAWVYEKIGQRKVAILKPAAAVTAVILLTLMSYATIKQTGIWKNCLVLWNYVIEEKSEKSAVAYYHRGIAYFDLKLPDLAIQDYTRAISLKPDYDEAYSNRGTAYREKGELDLAIEDYTRAISLTPHFKIYANRGDVFLSKGVWGNANEDFLKAIELNPKYEGGYNGLGKLYFFNAQYEQAYESFTRAIGLNPWNSGAFVNRGYTCMRQGNPALARADFLEACRLKNQNGCKAAQRLQL